MKMKSVLRCSPLLFLLLGAFSGCDLFCNTDPPVMYPIMEDSPDIWMGSYFGLIFEAPPPDLPDGIHRGIDHVAPIGTAIKASAPGTVIQIDEYTEPFDHTEVRVKLNHRYTVSYNFETAQSIEVTEGQYVDTGDILGYLGHFYLMPPTEGILDLGLLADDERICPIPFVTVEHKSLLELWFDRGWTRSATDPGPCTCHYTYP